jgi:predicted O-methyltransferase YrrM
MLAATELDPTKTPGWFNHGAKLLSLVDQVRPLVGVELGTWLGASAIPVVRVMRQWGGTLTCIDTWAGDVHPSDEVTRPSAPWMLVSCARNLMESGVGSSVRLIPSTTREAAKTWTTPIDWLYIDADHRYEAVWADLMDWVPHVRRGGLILGDDYGHKDFPGVKAAWDAFERAHGLRFLRYQSDPPNPDGIQLIYGTLEEPING